MLCGTNAATLIRFGSARSVSRYCGNVSKSHAMPGLQRLELHAFDELERLHHQLAILGPRRRDPEPAVALHDGGDAVPRRRREVRVPEHLRVEVRVDVDEAGCEHEAGQIDDLGAPVAVADRRRRR